VIGNRSFQNGGYGSGTIAPVGDPPHSLGDNRCNGTPC